jgi:hypothetical protein
MEDMSMIPTRLTILNVLILSLTATASNAGKNAGGALIVHTNDEFFLSDTCFDDPPPICMWNCHDDPGSCENANTQTDDYYGYGSLIFCFAAFPEESTPGLSEVRFGLDHNLDFPYPWVLGFCGPEGSTEVADQGWPENPSSAGTRVIFGSPVVGEGFFILYWFYVQGRVGSRLGTSIHPGFGYAGFVSDDDPAIVDECTRFGQIRWFQPGNNECPEAQTSEIEGEDGSPGKHTSWGEIRTRYR